MDVLETETVGVRVGYQCATQYGDSTGQPLRWSLQLQEYYHTIKRRPGKSRRSSECTAVGPSLPRAAGKRCRARRRSKAEEKGAVKAAVGSELKGAMVQLRGGGLSEYAGGTPRRMQWRRRRRLRQRAWTSSDIHVRHRACSTASCTAASASTSAEKARRHDRVEEAEVLSKVDLSESASSEQGQTASR